MHVLKCSQCQRLVRDLSKFDHDSHSPLHEEGTPKAKSKNKESLAQQNRPRISLFITEWLPSSRAGTATLAGQHAGRGCKMSDYQRKCVLWGPTSWMQGTYSDTNDCCSPNGMSRRPREAESPLCQEQAVGRAMSLTKPPPTRKRSFRSGCIRLTVVSCVRSRRH